MVTKQRIGLRFIYNFLLLVFNSRVLLKLAFFICMFINPLDVNGIAKKNRSYSVISRREMPRVNATLRTPSGTDVAEVCSEGLRLAIRLSFRVSHKNANTTG